MHEPFDHENRAGLDALVLRISSRFIDLPAEQYGAVLEEALGEIARYVDADTGYVILRGPDGRLRRAHVWRAPTMPSLSPEELASFSPEDIEAWFAPAGGGPVIVRTMDEVPERSAEVARHLRQHGIGALVDVPLRTSGRLLGFAGFASARGPRDWSAAEVTLLQHAAQVFTHVIRREEAQLQLRQTQKMEVVGRLAGGIAHDFNNLLLGLSVSADIAARYVPAGPSPLRRALDDMRDAIERAASLTRQLLTFSRLQPVLVRPIDLNALVEGMVLFVRRLVRESIDVEVLADGALPTVEADPLQLEQVLLNLCVNASDAMPSGGRLTIRTEALGRRRSEDGSTRPWARMVVADTGIGMTPHVRERVFEPFFTTKPPGRGTGLGLSTVYGIVERHGGAITVASELGSGTAFSIDLPGSDRPPQAGRLDPPEERAPGRERLLLAEDDAKVRRIIATLLEQEGYCVVPAADGEEAIEKFRAQPREIALVILDAVMPRKSGLDAFREIVQIDPDVPILFTSGYSTTVFPEGFFDDGRYPLLEKPYEAETLLRLIRGLVRPR